MKKVICVDAKYHSITKGNSYKVLNEKEDAYCVYDDNGITRWLPKECFRLVPEAEYQYGQEVEGSHLGKDNITGFYLGTVKLIHGKVRYIIQSKLDQNHLEILSDIRPLQSMREKVIQEIQMALPPIKGDRTAEVLADRIIELVKNEKK